MVPERTRTSQKPHQSGSSICMFWHQSLHHSFWSWQVSKVSSLRSKFYNLQFKVKDQGFSGVRGQSLEVLKSGLVLTEAKQGCTGVKNFLSPRNLQYHTQNGKMYSLLLYNKTCGNLPKPKLRCNTLTPKYTNKLITLAGFFGSFWFVLAPHWSIVVRSGSF